MTEKSHMSDILCKVYMGKIVICCTLAMSIIIIALYLCFVTLCMCICTRMSKNSRSFAVYEHKESSLVWQDPFLMQRVYWLQYRWLAIPLTIVIYTV